MYRWGEATSQLTGNCTYRCGRFNNWEGYALGWRLGLYTYVVLWPAVQRTTHPACRRHPPPQLRAMQCGEEEMLLTGLPIGNGQSGHNVQGIRCPWGPGKHAGGPGKSLLTAPATAARLRGELRPLCPKADDETRKKGNSAPK